MLASQKPERLAEFYAFVLDAEIKRGLNFHHYWVLAQSGVKIQIYLPSRNCLRAMKGRSFSLCLTARASNDPISTIGELSSQIILKGASVLEEPRKESFGAEMWISDPDKNDFLILVPNLE